MILNEVKIKELIENHNLVSNYIDLEKQLQPTSFDLTLEEIYRFNPHYIGEVSFNEKQIAPTELINPKGVRNKYWELEGNTTYKFKINETIKLPNSISAMTTQRSTLMRSGVMVNVGWWDAGYHGSGYSTLIVNHPKGFRIYKDARVINMVFMETQPVFKIYSGSYQGENVNE